MSRRNSLRWKTYRRWHRAHKKEMAASRMPYGGVILPRGAYNNLMYLSYKGLIQ